MKILKIKTQYVNNMGKSDIQSRSAIEKVNMSDRQQLHTE